MIKWSITAAGIFLLSLTSSQVASCEETVEAAAQAIVHQMVSGWNAGDGVAFAEPFRHDAGYRVWNGRFLDGKKAIAEGHQRIFDTFYRATELELVITEIRPITEQVVAVYLEGQISRNGEPVTQPVPMQGALPVLILARSDVGWEAVIFQNTPNVVMPRRPQENSRAEGEDAGPGS